MTASDISDSMEERFPLDDILDMLRVRGTLMANLEAHAPFGLRVPQAPGAAFHGVTAGGFWVRVPGEAPRELVAGDVMLLPTGAPHVIASDPVGPTRLWDSVAKGQAKNRASRSDDRARVESLTRQSRDVVDDRHAGARSESLARDADASFHDVGW